MNRDSGLLEAIGREFVNTRKNIDMLLHNVFKIMPQYYRIERGLIQYLS